MLQTFDTIPRRHHLAAYILQHFYLTSFRKHFNYLELIVTPAAWQHLLPVGDSPYELVLEVRPKGDRGNWVWDATSRQSLFRPYAQIQVCFEIPVARQCSNLDLDQRTKMYGPGVKGLDVCRPWRPLETTSIKSWQHIRSAVWTPTTRGTSRTRRTRGTRGMPTKSSGRQRRAVHIVRAHFRQPSKLYYPLLTNGQ